MINENNNERVTGPNNYLFNSLSGGWSPTGSTRHGGHWLAYCSLPWAIMMMENLVEWRLAEETEILEENPPQRLCPPQIPLDQTRDQTRAAAVGSQWLTVWATARPWVLITSIRTKIHLWIVIELAEGILKLFDKVNLKRVKNIWSWNSIQTLFLFIIWLYYLLWKYRKGGSFYFHTQFYDIAYIYYYLE
jgi:hypothetical protein